MSIQFSNNNYHRAHREHREDFSAPLRLRGSALIIDQRRAAEAQRRGEVLSVFSVGSVVV